MHAQKSYSTLRPVQPGRRVPHRRANRRRWLHALCGTQYPCVHAVSVTSCMSYMFSVPHDMHAMCRVGCMIYTNAVHTCSICYTLYMHVVLYARHPHACCMLCGAVCGVHVTWYACTCDMVSCVDHVLYMVLALCVICYTCHMLRVFWAIYVHYYVIYYTC